MSSNIRYGSVCSGIEAATVAWHDLGWEAQWFSEIEKFPSQVLAHHYPGVPNLGDMTLLTKNPIFNERPIDLLVGGTPCQSFSVAGLRHGLADSRGNLSLEFVRLLIAKQPKWFVWENVPGVLSSAGGADFASILSAFTGRSVEPQKFTKSGVIQGDPTSDNGAGYSIAYRVLDSQYFGVPQRRRRVFVIGHIGGDWRPPAAVLFERESLRRDFTPSREPRQKATGFTPTSFGGYGEGVGTLKKSGGDLGGGSETLISSTGETAHCLNAGGMGRQDYETETETMIVHGTQDPCVSTNTCFALGRNNGAENAVSYGIPGNWIGRKPENGGNAVAPMHNVAPCQTKTDKHAVAYSIQGSMVGRSPQSEEQQRIVEAVHRETATIRRLTPTECERLQGFPDGYTLIPKAADGPRYKALGNSMTTNVMKWLGTRIEAVNTLLDVL